jgi:malate dehydrogenase (oxaloacetate-decarboxylating)
LIVAALVQDGFGEADARSRLWLVDRDGPLQTGMTNLEPFQQCYCRPFEQVVGWKRNTDGRIPLTEVVRQVRPTVLIGVSGQPGTFSEEVIRTMAERVTRPVILPLSNPTSRSEAVPADLVAWTEGRGLIATGSPFSSVPFQGRMIPISQCNNAYIFPGLGLGVITAGTACVTDEMFLAAARVLSEHTSAQPDSPSRLLPAVEDILSVSRRIAFAVCSEAQRQGLTKQKAPQEWERLLDARRWEPHYLPMRRNRSGNCAVSTI